MSPEVYNSITSRIGVSDSHSDFIQFQFISLTSAFFYHGSSVESSQIQHSQSSTEHNKNQYTYSRKKPSLRSEHSPSLRRKSSSKEATQNVKAMRNSSKSSLSESAKEITSEVTIVSKEPTKESVTEPVKEPTKEPTKESVAEPMKEPTKEPIKEPAAELSPKLSVESSPKALSEPSPELPQQQPQPMLRAKPKPELITMNIGSNKEQPKQLSSTSLTTTPLKETVDHNSHDSSEHGATITKVPSQTTHNSVSSPLQEATPQSVILYSDLDLYNFCDYAAIYFQRKKPRIFHTFSLTELTSYSKDVPIRSLHPFPQMMMANVLDIERSVMMYMNITAMVSEPNSTDSEVYMELLERIAYPSSSNQDIFDEIVCFIMKETQGNPSIESEQLGFKLLYVLLSLRRPSLPLLKYVVSFVNNRLTFASCGGFARAIMLQLLDDSKQVNPEFHLSHFRKVCELAERVHPPFLESIRNSSVQEIIDTEDTAEILLRHGILPPKGGTFAWKPIQCMNDV